MFVGLQEGLLEHIFGVFPVLRNILRQPEDIALIALGQFVEGCAIALPSLGDQAGFIENSGFLWQISFYHAGRIFKHAGSRTVAELVAELLSRAGNTSARKPTLPAWRPAPR